MALIRTLRTASSVSITSSGSGSEHDLRSIVVILEIVEANLWFEPDHPLDLGIGRNAKCHRAVRTGRAMRPERHFGRFDGRAGDRRTRGILDCAPSPAGSA